MHHAFWFKRYIKRLNEICPKDTDDELVVEMWARRGQIERIGRLIDEYPNSPELAAEDIYHWELEGMRVDFYQPV